MSAPIKTCDYCDKRGTAFTFMTGETICPDCLDSLPSELRREVFSLRAEVGRLEEENKVLHSTAIVDAARVENAEGLVTELRAEVERLIAEVTSTAKKLDECRIDRDKAEVACDRYKAALERILAYDLDHGCPCHDWAAEAVRP